MLPLWDGPRELPVGEDSTPYHTQGVIFSVLVLGKGGENDDALVADVAVDQP